MPIPSRAPAERFASVLFWLGQAVVSRGLWGGLANPLVVLILNRIREIKQRFARLAARIAAGKYSPRTPAARRPGGGRPPARPNPLPISPAWLIKLVPEAAASASQLRILFADAEMAALLAAAPASFRRPLRSLCRMLGVEPPPILARPPATRRATRPAPTVAATAAERPPAQKPPKRPEKPRYVFGLRYPPPFKNPA